MQTQSSTRRIAPRGACLAAALAVAASLAGAKEKTNMYRFTVEAGEVERLDTPVCVELAGTLEPFAAAPCRLEELAAEGRRSPVPCQVEAGPPPRVWFILAGKTPKGARRTFELTPAAGQAAKAPAVTAERGEKSLDVSVGGAKVLRYNHAVVEPPAGQSPLYRRSGFIHPLWSPAGEVLTNIHPKDHIHHMGLWGAWTHTVFEGRKVDFWNIKDGKGTVRFVDFASVTGGPVFGGFVARQDHVDLKAPNGGEKVALHERLDVRVWNVGGPAGGWWLVDYVSTQRCATESPLELPAYRYGGPLGFRATADWKFGQADYLTSEGKTRKDGHGTRGRWCAAFGPTAKGPAGIAFLSSPANHEHPEPMRLWPDKDIFFNFCPVQQADWALKPGADHVFRYRFHVFSGRPSAETADRFWQDFARPPKVAPAR